MKMTNFKIGLLGVLISAKLILVYSWTSARDFQVWYGQYPNSTTSYPSIGNCYNCDYMRCIMSCTNDNGCTAMGYDTSAQSCYFLVGRLVNASYLKPSSSLNYYEKKYNDGFINLFRGGFYMIGFSYTAMSRMYVLQSFSGANNFSVVSRGYFTEKYIRNGNQLTSLTNITSLSSCQSKCQSHWNCAHLIYESSTSTCVLKDFSKDILSNCSSSDTCQSVSSNVIATPYQFYIGGFNTSFYYDYQFAFMETDGMTWSDFYYYYGL